MQFQKLFRDTCAVNLADLIKNSSYVRKQYKAKSSLSQERLTLHVLWRGAGSLHKQLS